MLNEIGKWITSEPSITDKDLIVQYTTDDNFDINILENWPKAITVPYKVSKYLKRNYRFIVNNIQIDISKFIN